MRGGVEAGRAAEVAGAWPARARSPEQHGRGLAPLGHTWPGKAFTALRLAWPGGGGGGGRARQAAVMLACLAVAWRAEERVPCRQAGGQAAALAKLACQGRHWQLCMHVRVGRRCCREGAYCSGTRTGTRGIILWHALGPCMLPSAPWDGAAEAAVVRAGGRHRRQGRAGGPSPGLAAGPWRRGGHGGAPGALVELQWWWCLVLRLCWPAGSACPWAGGRGQQ